MCDLAMDRRPRLTCLGCGQMCSEPGDPSAPAGSLRLANQLCGMFPTSVCSTSQNTGNSLGLGGEQCHPTQQRAEKQSSL